MKSSHFNTSNVINQLTLLTVVCSTSFISIHQMLSINPIKELAKRWSCTFQYIKYYQSTNSSLGLIKGQLKFQYIKCYQSTERG